MTSDNRRDLQAGLFVFGLGLAILLGAAALHAQPDVARAPNGGAERRTPAGGRSADALVSRGGSSRRARSDTADAIAYCVSRR